MSTRALLTGIAVLLLATGTAQAQIQPGPNLTPLYCLNHGRRCPALGVPMRIQRVEMWIIILAQIFLLALVMVIVFSIGILF